MYCVSTAEHSEGDMDFLLDIVENDIPAVRYIDSYNRSKKLLAASLFKLVSPLPPPPAIIMCTYPGKAGTSITCISLSSSAQCSGCVVDGLGAMAAV